MISGGAGARLLRGSVRIFSAVAALAVLVMMGMTCLDIVLRLGGRPLRGTYDIVRMAGAVAIICAIPHTTAAKGHVAIEFFFHRLNRIGRIIVDAMTRGLSLALFGFLGWRFIEYGIQLRRLGQVSDTLQIPFFWIPWLTAASLGLTVLVILYHLFHPGRVLVRP